MSDPIFPTPSKPERTGAVKALEWTPLSTGWITHTPFHSYEVVRTKHGAMATYANQDFAWGEENTMKAAAQADYERRVLSALSPALQEPEQEADYEETITSYEFMAREFDRLAILRKMWSAAEVASVIRRMEIPEPHPAPQAPVAAVEGQAVAIKPLEWRHYPDAFPPMWVANAALGHYSIEEAAGSDSPSYDVLNPTMGRIANVDGLSEAKQVAQTDHDKRVRVWLTSPVQPAGTDAIREALEPFARAWEIATNYKSVVHALTLGQLGSLAAHEVSANQFRNAYRPLNPTSEKNDG